MLRKSLFCITLSRILICMLPAFFIDTLFCKIHNPAVPPTFFHFELFLCLPKPSVLKNISEEPSHILKFWGMRERRKGEIISMAFQTAPARNLIWLTQLLYPLTPTTLLRASCR